MTLFSQRNKENLKIVIVSIAEIIISDKYKIQNPKETDKGRISVILWGKNSQDLNV